MDVLKLVLLIIQVICGIPMLWSVCVVLISCFKKKRISPKAEKKHKFAVVICAHNEERTIGLLLNSIGMTDYPKELVHIFVLAHNCSDNTAEVVRRFGNATVIEVNDDSIGSKGALLNAKLSGIIDEHFGEIDAVTFFDADNVADPGFFDAVNDAVAAGESIIMGNRLAGGALDSLAERLMALYWIIYDNLISVSRYNIGLSPCITGTGFTIAKDFLIKNPWSTKTITEDVEYSVDSLLKGMPVSYCKTASFFDEQPDNFKALTIQLHRWCTGSYEILGLYFSGMFKKMWTDVRVFDLLLCLLLGPAAVIATFVFVVLLIISVIQMDIPVLAATLAATLGGYIFISLIALVHVIRIKDQGDRSKIYPMIPLIPLFFIYYTFCSFAAWVHPQKKWVPIAHKGFGKKKTGEEG